jgi:ribosomal protein S27E
MSKSAKCNKCGKENLVWNQSKKGNWYLSDPATISTKLYGSYLTIPFAHKCPVIAEEVESDFNKIECSNCKGRYLVAKTEVMASTICSDCISQAVSK